MKKYVKYLSAALLIPALLAGCNNASSNEESPYDLGLKALENENTEEAKEQFKDVSEENKDKADNYLKLINTAEEIDKSMEDEKYNNAIDSYETIQSNDNLSAVEFIYADQKEDLKKIKETRTDINKKMDALNDFYSPDDKNMTANELYIAKTDEMLENNYLSDEQKSEIESFQEKVKDNMPKENSSQETNDTDKPKQNQNNQTEDKDTAKEKEEKTGDKEETTEDSSLSQEEAYDVVLDHLIDIGQISKENLQSDQYSLDFDHKASGKYVFQLYETVMDGEETGHKVTIGWYEVDAESGDVSEK